MRARDLTRYYALLLLCCCGIDVRAFCSTTSLRVPRPQVLVVTTPRDDRQGNYLLHRRQSNVYQASIAEETKHDFSADSQDPDDNNAVEITDLSQLVPPTALPPERIGKERPSYRRNPAMADTSFLRKRTANLLKVTSPEYEDAWAFSRESDAVQQAMRLLERMEDLKARGNNIQPDVRSYTKVINAISRSGNENAGEQADEILQKMEMICGNGFNPSAKPNTHTYTAVIEAHANSGAPASSDRAAQLCETMVQKYNAGDNDITPTSRAFQAALVAYAKSSYTGSSEQAEQLVNRMETLYDSGIEEMKPTAVNLNTLITAWANCGEEGSAQRAEDVLRRMEYMYREGDEDLKPTSVSFNAVIDAYAKSGEEGAAQKAELVLRYMEELYESGENKDAKPNVRSFNSVINAWAKSRDPENALHAQEILDRMEKLYEEGNKSVRPDVHSFSTVINAWARSSMRGKADRAFNLYREMESLYKAGNKHLRPTVVAFNAVMNACAYTNNSDLHEQNRAIEIAHRLLRELERSPYGVPDQVTYGTFLKVCANQMPDCDNRRTIVDSIFKKCCNDGQVGNLVLQQLKAITDEEQYERLVGRSIYDDVRMEDLPSDWWSNVVEGRWRRRKNQSQN